jgi:hypothetical protein
MPYDAFTINRARGQLADLEVRHRLRALRRPDPERQDTGLKNLP